MKIAGIIAEYNPFHNGHKYHIEQTRKITGADFIIVVMSGNFTQRGTPAIIDKYSRTRMALENGADMVIQLPSCYACGSAEYFADGAIALLDKLGCVDYVCFGSECGDIELLRPIAEILATEPDDYREMLKSELKNGATFPRARNRALIHCIPSFAANENIIGSPNNILGIEYMKSIIRRGSKIKPVTIQRTGSDYHSQRFSQQYSSSLALRHSIDTQDSLDMIRGQVPENVYGIMEENYKKTYPLFPRDFSAMLKYKLLVEEKNGYTDFVDINEDLSDRILKVLYQSYDYEQMCDILKTKNITYARVSRLLCHILLNLRKDDMQEYKENGTVFYARVLGFRDDDNGLFKKIQSSSSIPVITKVTDGKKLTSEAGRKQFEQDILASHIYESIVASKYDCPMQNEYQRPVITV
ncbi:MAG: nucleotidyltransferase [Lachnospiraceae bacterium]|nr:nucleotidyltransferase [Lachnospiraceae bacterium]